VLGEEDVGVGVERVAQVCGWGVGWGDRSANALTAKSPATVTPWLCG
jgi:hypothetical protein